MSSLKSSEYTVDENEAGSGIPVTTDQCRSMKMTVQLTHKPLVWKNFFVFFTASIQKYLHTCKIRACKIYIFLHWALNKKIKIKSFHVMI